MNILICNPTELGIGNPSLSVSLIMIYFIRKAKTKFLCAAYSPRQYYSSSQTSVLSTGNLGLGEVSLSHEVRKERCFQEQTVPYIFCRSQIYLTFK